MCKRSDCALSVAAFLLIDDAKLRAEKMMIMIVISSLGRRLYQHKKVVVAALFGAQENCHRCIIWDTRKLLLLHYMGHKKTVVVHYLGHKKKLLLLHYLVQKKNVVATSSWTEQGSRYFTVWDRIKLLLLNCGTPENCCYCVVHRKPGAIAWCRTQHGCCRLHWVGHKETCYSIVQDNDKTTVTALCLIKESYCYCHI